MRLAQEIMLPTHRNLCRNATVSSNALCQLLSPSFHRKLGLQTDSVISKERENANSPKFFLKHFIWKQASFNNAQIALSKSESFGACSLKASNSVPERKLHLMPSFSEENQDLLEVCSSKAQASVRLNGLVTVSPAPQFFNYLSFVDLNTKVTLLRGSRCHSAGTVKKKANVEIGFPFSVSSKESTGLKSPYDHKADAKVEGVDLNILFEAH